MPYRRQTKGLITNALSDSSFRGRPQSETAFGRVTTQTSELRRSINIGGGKNRLQQILGQLLGGQFCIFLRKIAENPKAMPTFLVGLDGDGQLLPRKIRVNRHF
jgi:hypothetical protein